VSLALTSDAVLPRATDAIELLSRKMGLVLLVLGAMHFGNLYVLSRIRRRRSAPALQPPVQVQYQPHAQNFVPSH
jgi:hypothetical protein